MRNRTIALAVALVAVATATVSKAQDKDGWHKLFDGKTLNGWRASENSESCKVVDGKIVLFGPRSHLFYVGDVNGGAFRNFEFKAEVYVHPGSNSGIYLHTEYQEKGWPGKGYECQVNNTHKDRKKTGGLYAVADVLDNAPVKDNEWFDYHITVKGKRIAIRINDKITADYTEPPDLNRPRRQLSSGTFALQAHDPKSKVEYRSVMVKPLPDE